MSRTGTRTHAELDVDREETEFGSNLLLNLLSSSIGGEVNVSLDSLGLLAAEGGLEDKVGKLGTGYNVSGSSVQRKESTHLVPWRV